MAKKSSKAIQSAIDGLEKRFKEPLVLKMSESSKANITTFSSGRLDLDKALGGGYAVGKIIEILAEEATGKTGLALEAIREVQKAGGNAAVVDAEHALNIDYAKSIGVNVDDLYISQPSYGEQAFEVIRALINSADIDLIVVDSVSSMIPKAELDGESGEAKIGLHARMMSQGMKMIVGTANTVGCTVIFINQLRDKIGGYVTFKVTSGGHALKFYAFQRLEIKKRGWIKEGEEVIGFKQEVKVIKNKAAAPFKVIENDIIYGKGVDKITSLIETATELGILERKGAWYSYEDTNIAQGIAKLRGVLEDNPDIVDAIVIKIQNATK